MNWGSASLWKHPQLGILGKSIEGCEIWASGSFTLGGRKPPYEGRPGSSSFPEYPCFPVPRVQVHTHVPQNFTPACPNRQTVLAPGLKIRTTFPYQQKSRIWTLPLNCSFGDSLSFQLSQLTQIDEGCGEAAHSQSHSHLPHLGLPSCRGRAGSSGPKAQSWGKSMAGHTDPSCQQGKGKGR